MGGSIDRNKASVGRYGKAIMQCLPGDHIHPPGVDERNGNTIVTKAMVYSAAEAKRQRKLARNQRLLKGK